MKVGCVCNNSFIQKDLLFGQPTEGALLAAGMKNGMYNVSDKYLRLQEYPFSSEQKMMAVKCVGKYDEVKLFFILLSIVISLVTKESVIGNKFVLFIELAYY